METAMTTAAAYTNEDEAEMFLKEHERCVSFAIRSRLSLIEAARIETEDMRQELRLCMWQVANKFRPGGRAKLSTFLIKCLDYRVLNLCRRAFAKKREAELRASPFVYQNTEGEWVEREEPDEVHYDGMVIMREFVDALSVTEKAALYRKLKEGGPKYAKDVAALKSLRAKAERHIRDSGWDSGCYA